MLQIVQAKEAQFDEVRLFYYSVIDAMRDAEFRPGWEKDIYPSPEMLREALQKGWLYLGYAEGSLASAMILNHEYNESYDNYQWKTQASGKEILVIHTLGVHPDHSRRGFGKEMVGFAIDHARALGCKAMRLDVLSGNLPAEKLYPSMGFHYLATLNMYYEDTGWTDFRLYELVL